mgnify:CR=1 FL=1
MVGSESQAGSPPVVVPNSIEQSLRDHFRHTANPPLWAGSEMHQHILGLDTAPRPLRLMVCACLDRPWSLLPAEPRVRPLVGHFRLAPKGT